MTSSRGALGRRILLEATMAGAFALLLLTTVAEPSAAYVALARRYARGERAAAVAELSRWSAKQLDQELEQVRAGAVGASRGLAARSLSEAPPLRAIVMLHTDRDALERGTSPSSTGPPRCGTRTHMELAERAATLLAGDPAGQGFSRRWVLAVALRALSEYCVDDARRLAHDGLEWFPHDPDLILVGGIVEEAAAFMMDVGAPVAVAGALERQRVEQQLVQERRILMGKARHSFEQALAAQGTLLPARLHLGRVRFGLEERQAARADLQAVLDAQPQGDLAYLAHLFLGQVHEADDRIALAETHYRQALATDPSAQAAAMALSCLLQLRGESEAARAVLETALGHAARRADDAFWGYLFYRTVPADPILEGLREETGR